MKNGVMKHQFAAMGNLFSGPMPPWRSIIPWLQHSIRDCNYD